MPPYLPLIANPVTSLQLVAQALLVRWPNVQTGCDRRPGHPETRTSWAGSPRSAWATGSCSAWSPSATPSATGCTTAALRGGPGSLRGADSAGSRQRWRWPHPTGQRCSPFDLTRPRSARSQQGLPRHDDRLHRGEDLRARSLATAQQVAQFIRVSTTEGQQPGAGNGQLRGRLPADHEDRRHRAALRPGAGRSRPPWPPSRRRRRRTAPRARRRPGVRDHTATPVRCRARHPAVPRRPRRRRPARRRRAARRRRSRTHRWSRRRPSRPGTGGGLLVLLLVIGLVAGLGALLSRTVLRTPGAAMSATHADPDAPARSGPANPRRRSHLVSSACTVIVLVCVWMLLQMLVLGRLSEARAQHLLYGEYRTQLATETAPDRGPRLRRQARGRRQPGGPDVDPRDRSWTTWSSSTAPRPATCSSDPVTSGRHRSRATPGRRW